MYSMQRSESICACVITKGYIKREREREEKIEREKALTTKHVEMKA